jgi:hypothetical protein
VERLMLRDLQAHNGRILRLAPFAEHDRCVLAQPRLASGADGWPLLHHLVRRADQPQRLAAMPQLSAWLLAALLAQTAALARQAVTAGRLAAVTAILRQSRFQVSYPLHEGLHLLTQRGVLRSQLGISSSGVMPPCYASNASLSE